MPRKKKPARRQSSAQTREHVLEVAGDLFYWEGVRAVGVDRVAEAAGIAPTTLYRLFPSKDDLIAAYVQRTDERYREWFSEATRPDGRSARERILALFDALSEQVQPDRCRGCPFLMTLSEFPDEGLASHRCAVTMKHWVRVRFGELVAELLQSTPVGEYEVLADRLTLIMEGVYASVQALGADGPARSARAFAEAILPACNLP